MKMISSMPLSAEQMEQLKRVRPDLEIETVKSFSEADPQAEALLTYGWDVTEATLDLYPNLKWIQGMSAGVDPFPLAKLAKRDILLTNVRGAHAIQMSEHVMWSILNLFRQGRQVMRQQEEKVWSAKVRVDEIYGKTVCIVGAGTIGAAVAERCRAFGMKVMGITRSGESNPLYDQVGSVEELQSLFEKSDVIVAILPLTQDTKNFFNTERFSLMKNGAYFVNVARGPVVDEEALLQALNSGKLRGAALDVFVKEPLTESSPFWDMENVLITPHIGGRSSGYTKRMFDVLVKNIKAYPNRNEMINHIQFDRGY
jgi:D-2-hydroxyacid dehydrogenase (NADP+)